MGENLTDKKNKDLQVSGDGDEVDLNKVRQKLK